MARKRQTKKQRAEAEAAATAVAEILVDDLPPPDRQLPAPTEEPPFEPGSFTARVSTKAHFAPVPDGFMNVATFPEAGIKVNKSHDKRTVAIQFAEDRIPTRDEKDLLEALHSEPEDGFAYDTGTRQWLRHTETPGANIIDAVRLAKELAQGREGRGL